MQEKNDMELEELDSEGREDDAEQEDMEEDKFSEGHVSETSDFFMEAMERSVLESQVLNLDLTFTRSQRRHSTNEILTPENRAKDRRSNSAQVQLPSTFL
jgi:hypothetical protein